MLIATHSTTADQTADHEKAPRNTTRHLTAHLFLFGVLLQYRLDVIRLSDLSNKGQFQDDLLTWCVALAKWIAVSLRRICKCTSATKSTCWVKRASTYWALNPKPSTQSFTVSVLSGMAFRAPPWQRRAQCSLSSLGVQTFLNSRASSPEYYAQSCLYKLKMQIFTILLFIFVYTYTYMHMYEYTYHYVLR